MRNKKDYIAAVYIEGIIEEKNNYYNQKWLLSVIDNLPPQIGHFVGKFQLCFAASISTVLGINSSNNYLYL